jgi:hypothetical protein
MATLLSCLYSNAHHYGIVILQLHIAWIQDVQEIHYVTAQTETLQTDFPVVNMSNSHRTTWAKVNWGDEYLRIGKFRE